VPSLPSSSGFGSFTTTESLAGVKLIKPAPDDKLKEPEVVYDTMVSADALYVKHRSAATAAIMREFDARI